MQEKIAAWHQERTWRIDASALEVCEQDVLGKGAWGVVKRGKLARSGGGEEEEVALKMWPHADAALAERLCAHEAAVYKAAAGCRRTCVMHGTSTLKGLACSGQRLPGSLLLRCAADLFEGLASLHSRRILVRDLNIQNLLLDDNERLVIVDLGVALVLAPHQTSIQPDEVLGTANYLPPEALSALNSSTPTSSSVASALHLSLKSDVWCAAACILHMASGKRPFDGMSWTQVANHVSGRRAVPALPSEIQGPLRDILMQCFAWNAQDRPAASAAYDLCRSLLAPWPSPAMLSVNSSVTEEGKQVKPLIVF
jgi:serine/threonine protein kinase